jgi:hypothetical protein
MKLVEFRLTDSFRRWTLFSDVAPHDRLFQRGSPARVATSGGKKSPFARFQQSIGWRIAARIWRKVEDDVSLPFLETPLASCLAYLSATLPVCARIEKIWT